MGDQLRIAAVEAVGAEQMGDAHGDPVGLRTPDDTRQQLEVGAGGKIMPPELQSIEARIGARALRQQQVTHGHVIPDATTGADAHDPAHGMDPCQLGGVDRAGRNPHAAAHHRNALSSIVAGVAKHVAARVHLHHVFEQGLGDVAGAQRIAGKQHRIGDVAGHSGQVWRTHAAAPRKLRPSASADTPRCAARLCPISAKVSRRPTARGASERDHASTGTHSRV